MEAAPTPDWLDRSSFPFSRRYVQLRDGRIHLVDDGDGPPIVFVHGTPTWSYEYRHLLAAFRGRYRVIAPDHLGFGLSDRPRDADYSPEAHAARFAELLDTLDLHDVVLVVHDYGGPIALAWAAAHPERLRGLVLLNTFAGPIRDPQTRRVARWLRGAFGRWLYRVVNLSLRVILPSAYGVRRRLTRDVHAHYLAPFAEPWSRVTVLHALARGLVGSEAFFARLAASLPRLAPVPTTIVWGERDPAFGPGYRAELCRSFPHSELNIVRSAGHWPHEETPEEVVSAMNSSLERWVYRGRGQPVSKWNRPDSFHE